MKKSKQITGILFGTIAFGIYFTSSGAVAATGDQVLAQTSVMSAFKSVVASFPRNLEGNEPTYFVIVPPHKIDTKYKNVDVQEHLEFNVSIRYPLFDKSLDSARDKLYRAINAKSSTASGSHKIFFLYRGRYDFFAGSRYSSPVISRIQNPGIAYYYKRNDDTKGVFRSVKLGWYHESNGQFIDEELYNDSKIRYATISSDIMQELDSLDSGIEALDHISRGWDYLGLELKWSLARNHEIYSNFRVFCNCQAFGTVEKEDKIFWEADPHNANIKKYDGIQLIYNYIRKFNSPMEVLRFSGLVRSGWLDNPYERLTYKLEATAIIKGFPVTLFYFNGYGENIALYHVKSDYIGIGIELW